MDISRGKVAVDVVLRMDVRKSADHVHHQLELLLHGKCGHLVFHFLIVIIYLFNYVKKKILFKFIENIKIFYKIIIENT